MANTLISGMFMSSQLSDKIIRKWKEQNTKQNNNILLSPD
jgi:hypothetical protein